MSKTKKDITHIQRTIQELNLVSGFLMRFEKLLESLTYENMMEKLGTDYKDTPYVSFWAGAESVQLTVSGPEQRETMRALRKAIGGKWEKGGHGSRFELTREWGEGEVTISLEIEGERENICQRIVTGTRVREIPEVEYQPARTEEVEEVEWVCGNLLDD